MKTFFAWVGCITAIITSIFYIKSCNDLKDCQMNASSLQMQVENVTNQYQKSSIENTAIKLQIDSLGQVIKANAEQYNKNIELANNLREIRDSLINSIESLDSVIDSDNQERIALKDSLGKLNEQIISLEDSNNKLWEEIRTLTNISDTIGNYEEKYLSIISNIDSFFIPFRIENITMTPKVQKKKGMYVPATSKNGKYYRTDISIIDFEIKSKLSDIFLLNLPDSILNKKKEPLEIFVHFFTIPQNKAIKEDNKIIMGKQIKFNEIIQLDLIKGNTTVSYTSPFIKEKGEIPYYFKFYTKYSSEPFYECKFVTQ